MAMQGKFTRDNKQHQDFSESLAVSEKILAERKAVIAHLDASLAQRLKVAAASHGVPMRVIIEEALMTHLDNAK